MESGQIRCNFYLSVEDSMQVCSFIYFYYFFLPSNFTVRFWSHFWNGYFLAKWRPFMSCQPPSWRDSYLTMSWSSAFPPLVPFLTLLIFSFFLLSNSSIVISFFSISYILVSSVPFFLILLQLSTCCPLQDTLTFVDSLSTLFYSFLFLKLFFAVMWPAYLSFNNNRPRNDGFKCVTVEYVLKCQKMLIIIVLAIM